jgi:hypothetical protein
VAREGTITEWKGRAGDDEDAAHRLAQHLKTKLEQQEDGYTPDDLITLSRVDGAMVTAARAKELIERLHGWKTAPSADPHLEVE